MRIDQATIQLASNHAAEKKHEVSERLRAWTGDRRPDFEALARRRASLPAAIARISEEARARLAEAPAEPEKADGDHDVTSDPKLRMMIALIERLTGEKVRITRLEDFKAAAASTKLAEDLKQPAQPQRAGWGIEYDRHESTVETEVTTVEASGVVRTADGQEIAFDIDLSMKRAFAEEKHTSVRAGDAAVKDPLVINFAGAAAQLTSNKFAFDLDADGSAEDVSFVTPGSGFLVFDRNGDGKVNNGSELFGPLTGNGWNELAALDSDPNGWIDEGDAAFSRLGVWTRDATGTDSLRSLAQSGVGAISLGAVASPFELKDSTNQLHGRVVSTGVYLTEAGGAGTVQQVDLAI